MATLPAGLKLSLTLKDLWINHQAVQKAKDRSVRQGITKGLRYIRTRSRQSLRRRKRPSKPGEKPSVHSRGRGLKTILWHYDPMTQSGIVGPVKLSGTNPKVKPSTTAPNVFEQGGALNFLPGAWMLSRKPARDRRSGRFIKNRGGRVNKRTRVRVRPRPFMVPALEFEVAAGNISGAFHATFHE